MLPIFIAQAVRDASFCLFFVFGAVCYIYFVRFTKLCLECIIIVYSGERKKKPLQKLTGGYSDCYNIGVFRENSMFF